MPIATYRGEASVGEIADRLYVGLTPRQRGLVEEALLRANPRLRDVATVAEGTVLRIPDVAEVRPKATDEGGRVDAEIVRRVAAAVEGWGARVGERHALAESERREDAAALKNRRLKTVLETMPAAKGLAEAAGKDLARRSRDAAKRRADGEALREQAINDLKKLL